MNKEASSPLAVLAVRPLGVRQASNGETFDFSSDLWELSGTADYHKFNFEWCNEALTPEMKESLKEAVALQLKRLSTGTASTRLFATKRFFMWLYASNKQPLGIIKKADVARYRLTDPGGSDVDIKSLVLDWQELGRPGFEEDAVDALAEINRETNEYFDVLTLDPEKGPYFEDEIAIVDRALQGRYEEGQVTDAQYVLMQIFRLYGQRPAMVANIKLGDVRTPRHHAEEASVRFEVLKQRKGNVRRHGPKRPAPMLFTFALENYLDLLTGRAPVESWDLEAPLFPAKTSLFSVELTGDRSERALEAREQTARGYEGHMNSGRLSRRYTKLLDSLKIISPRTGKLMVLNPTRDRHTIATIMAMRGCTAEEIAAWLHHTDTKSCQAYIELAWQHHQLMSSLLDGKLNHVAGQFLGYIIKRDLETFPSQAIITAADLDDAPSLGGCAVGGCAAIDSLAAPFACFLCREFHLSVDADLDPLLRLLFNRREEAKRWGDDEYGRLLNRHIAALLAAKQEQQAARARRGEIS